MDLKTLRRELKAIGFNFMSERLSWGKHVTYRTIEGTELTGNVFTPETLKIWQPLFDYLKENKERIKTISENEGEKIYGLFPG